MSARFLLPALLLLAGAPASCSGRDIRQRRSAHSHARRVQRRGLPRQPQRQGRVQALAQGRRPRGRPRGPHARHARPPHRPAPPRRKPDPPEGDRRRAARGRHSLRRRRAASTRSSATGSPAAAGPTPADAPKLAISSTSRPRARSSSIPPTASACPPTAHFSDGIDTRRDAPRGVRVHRARRREDHAERAK